MPVFDLDILLFTKHHCIAPLILPKGNLAVCMYAHMNSLLVSLSLSLFLSFSLSLASKTYKNMHMYMHELLHTACVSIVFAYLGRLRTFILCFRVRFGRCGLSSCAFMFLYQFFAHGVQ